MMVPSFRHGVVVESLRWRHGDVGIMHLRPYHDMYYDTFKFNDNNLPHQVVSTIKILKSKVLNFKDTT